MTLPQISRLSYQVFRPRVVDDMKACGRGCGRRARGGGACAECLAKDLAHVAGETLAFRLLRAMEDVQNTINEIEDATAVPEEF